MSNLPFNEVWAEGGTTLQGFSEVDERGVNHYVEWEEYEVMPDVSYEIWVCKTHDRPYYGQCIKELDK